MGGYKIGLKVGWAGFYLPTSAAENIFEILSKWIAAKSLPQ
jgi:hypothetical protein